MKRKTFLVFASTAVLAMTLSVGLVLGGCTFEQSAEEVLTILNDTLPEVQGIGAVVAIADPAISPAIVAGIAAYQNALTIAGTGFTQWQTADAANQPGALGSFEAAMTVLKDNFAQIVVLAHVKNQAHQNSIDLLASAVESAITEVVTLVLQTKAAGGTTTAALLVLHENYGGGREPEPSGTKPAKVKKNKLAKAPISAAHMKADLKTRLALKTGDSKLDAVRAQIAASLK